MHDFSPGSSSAILPQKAPDIRNGLLTSYVGGQAYNIVEDSWIIAYLGSKNLPTSIARLQLFHYNEFNRVSMSKILERITCPSPKGPDDGLQISDFVRLPDKSARRDTAY
ncbi:hypothetical protein MFRU_006g03250 [Monilinia fructicola]|nr:hypothetical protein MFRU_006g03250 [Monilinia fructicola]